MARKATTTEVVTAEGWVELTCAFCRGAGRDPFGLLSVLSTCNVCGGKGEIRVRKPYVTCRACGGTGAQAFTRLSCQGCGGKGVQSIKEPVETCPDCGGKGLDGHLLYCLRCHGAGVIPATEEDAAA